MTMKKTLSVSSIKEGTVIDHITQGQSRQILQLLNLHCQSFAVTIGLNLMSLSLGKKDLIKISDYILSDADCSNIAIFAPQATINFIEDYKISRKRQVLMPETIRGILVCPNENCITHGEPVDSFFNVTHHERRVLLHCHYCERHYERQMIKECVIC
jgi:aspartate carbamoyltransferase regulatory subunit